MMTPSPQADVDSTGLTFGEDDWKSLDEASGWKSSPCVVAVRHLYVSQGHNFFRHHGQPPVGHRIREVFEIECVAGPGIRVDRFFDYTENYKERITFFAAEIYDALRRELVRRDKAPSVFRRNVITGGVDLNVLIGSEF